MGYVDQYLTGLEKTIRDLSHADVQAVVEALLAAWREDRQVFIIGNGGSAGIASHMAIDYSKNGNIRSQAFNDSSALTCLGNDLGYENVFSKQIELHARFGDLLVAISSSGNSENILGGVDQARESGCQVVALSGFAEDNRLRGLGDINFYAPSQEYGFVEITHLALCHAVVDFAMGWQPDS